jgi:hypothetical protein
MCTQACNLTLNNTGEVACPSIFDYTTAVYLMPLVGSAGTNNKIDISAFQAAPKTYIEGLVNQSNPLDRIYPINNLKNVTDERGEPVFEEFEDGTKNFVKEGVRVFTALKPKVSTRWVKRVNGVRCAPNFGVFFVTNGNQIVGKRISDTDEDMYPVEVEKQSFYVGLTKATPTTVQKGAITFEISPSENDGDLVMIPASEMGTLRPNSLGGLVDAVASYSGISTTGVTITLSVFDSNIMANVPVTGLLTGDLALYNVTDSAAVANATFTESSDGVYDVTFAAQTVSDVMRATFTKAGYDFSLVTENTFIIV